MLDPRDAALQAHTPVVMVPRFGELPLLDAPGHRYLAAANGLWLDLLRPWLWLRIHIAEAPAEFALPFGELITVVNYAFQIEDLARVQALFLRDARAAMPDEFAAWAVWNERDGLLEYRPLLADAASPGGISFHRPQLEAHESLAIDLHSHGALDAFFSATDDADDAGEVKLAVVAGALDREPNFATRLCVLGMFFDDERAPGAARKDARESVCGGACRVCGCTEERACEGGCSWVEPDLCSACA